MKKNILGLDLGTNSIGWALVEQDFENKNGNILGMGSRIIPMSQDILGEFGKGNSVSQTAERTAYRSVRRLRERYLLRRERLHRVLNILGFLPEHYAIEIDFEKHLGKFKKDKEPKLVYKPIWNKSTLKYEYDFIFRNSFNEMMENFGENQPKFLLKANGEKALIPYDWTIYYLRKKALTQKIEKEELAWLLINFNQKRGYYQLRGEEEEENPNKLIEYHSLKIIDVQADQPQNEKTEIWYSMKLENGWTYRRSSKTPLYDWKGKIRDFIVTTELNEDQSVKKDKEGNEKRSFRAPGEDDWTLLKKKTEQEIENSNKTVGRYIYDSLLANPKQKINGRLIRTIERKYYKKELEAILVKQKEFHHELRNDEMYFDCVRELYRNNNAHELQLRQKDLVHLFINDIIFYQRPLKSQKSSIGNCTFEYHRYKDKDGIERRQYLKGIPKSHPYFQEFRIWQWMDNLSLYRKDEEENIISEFLSTTEDWESLFDFLNNRREVEQSQLLEFLLKRKLELKKIPKAEIDKYRWNYVENKKYPMNETRGIISSRLEKVIKQKEGFFTKELELKLWHLIYSVTDKIEFEKSLKTFASKYELDEFSFIESFKKIPPFKSEYSSFSEKAIKKLLPLMRRGKYWNEEVIYKNNETYLRNINQILEKLSKKFEGISEQTREEWNASINTRLKEQLKEFLDGDVKLFQGLRVHIALYLVYGRYSEHSDLMKWNSVDDLEQFLKEFKQHSLRNPIVEQIITETLRVVKDIWKFYGAGAKDFFDEIHIELGRELKNTADDRKIITNQVIENENTNLRIKALLVELDKDENVENVRPYSPMQHEILKIYEDGILKSNIELPDEILKISKTAQPTSSDLHRYKLWLEQKYRSPYTGEIIPLNRLFTTDYEIEHIIPQSRFFDDSFNNKVICESAVNKLKDNEIGLKFIKENHGRKVQTGFGKTVEIFEVEAYEDFVKKHYIKNRSKRNRLLMEEIPEKMIERQMNDTRYISKYISGILSNIVREETNDNNINSKKLIQGNGKITTILKQDWGLNDVWNDIILPRFERLNKLTNSSNFTVWNEKHKKYLPTIPIELSKGFSKKRIDHRHHALDALVIACATKDHINLLNNQSAKSENKRFDLQFKLRYREPYFNIKEQRNKDAFKEFIKPWESFTQDARLFIEKIVVSFKQNLRVINKATNHFEKWTENNGVKKKALVVQKGINWAIRKPMHKETVSGKVNLPWIKVPKGKTLTATRKLLDTSFNLKTIQSITDTGIQKILKNYLESKNNNPEIAFSPEGIEDMNKNLLQYNGGKCHHPIFKVRVFEIGSKFTVGASGNKKDKYVEAATGTNLFFAVYQNNHGKRSYATIPLNEVIERQKQGLSPVPETNEKEDVLLFTLSPNDLVYVPTEEEIENISTLNISDLDLEKRQRIYKVVSFTGNRLSCIPYYVSSSIINKVEYTQLNKIEFTLEKESCLKINVNRLGKFITD